MVGGRTTNGTPIDIWDYSGGANQQWTLTPTSGGYYRITMGNDTNDCLEVPGSSTTPGVLLDECPYTGGNNQQWKLVTNSSSAYYIEHILIILHPMELGLVTLDIQGEEDAYERTGSSYHQTLVNNLCATWLVNNPPPWTWDHWNDDIGWFSLALIRGYQMTGNTNFLAQAEYGFNMPSHAAGTHIITAVEFGSNSRRNQTSQRSPVQRQSGKGGLPCCIKAPEIQLI